MLQQSLTFAWHPMLTRGVMALGVCMLVACSADSFTAPDAHPMRSPSAQQALTTATSSGSDGDSFTLGDPNGGTSIIDMSLVSQILGTAPERQSDHAAMTDALGFDAYLIWVSTDIVVDFSGATQGSVSDDCSSLNSCTAAVTRPISCPGTNAEALSIHNAFATWDPALVMPEAALHTDTGC